MSKYEKAMGKKAKKGPVRAAPWKVHWAFQAANDLENFRRSLIVQLDILKILMQGKNL